MTDDAEVIEGREEGSTETHDSIDDSLPRKNRLHDRNLTV